MTNQEYDQQKRECWEQFCRHIVDEEEEFYNMFDHAFALGRETETITPEELAQKASKWSDKILMKSAMLGPMALSARDIAYRSYIAGVSDSFGKQEKDADTVIQGWVARDSDGDLFFYNDKPRREKAVWDEPQYWIGETQIDLAPNLFPDLTWDDEPQEVEIIIKRKNK